MMHRLQCFLHCLLLLLVAVRIYGSTDRADHTEARVRNAREQSTLELPRPLLLQDNDNNDLEDTKSDTRNGRSYRPTIMDMALQASVREGIQAMAELYGRIEPQILRNGQLLAENHPAAILSKFSAPTENTTHREMAAYAAITATKAFKRNYKQIDDLARQAHNPKVSLRRTALEGLCPPRDPPICTPASERYRTHDGTCNNHRRLRWGAAQMPFNRFLPPEYGDGVDTIRNGVNNEPLSSSRFVSLLVHGAKDGEAPLTLMTAQWGQLLDHDMTSTAQPRSINGSVPSCCGGKDFHPSCFPIKVPLDDPWLAPLKVRCLEFLRSAPAQRRDCVLSWREQTNQATSFIDASPIYSSSSKSSDNARAFRKGLLIFGRGNPAEDVCQRGALARQCIRSGDGRSGEQPGLLALHQVWVGEHNRIATELSELNVHWSDEKIYQETRRIVGAMFQHITYREFLPIILGREVCKLFELDLQTSGYYDGYDPKTNPTVANSFAAAAFRFGHSLIQDSYMRCDRHHNRINNSVNLHEEFQRGDIGSAGSLHRLLRGLATQRALKRDEFISPELTNHLFQTPGFPFGLDLAAINIQRGRDHGIAPYTSWRAPCGLSPINSWNDFANIVGPESAKRIAHAYRSVHDIDLFVGGISERPVIGGLVGPTFACVIAQQFSNSRKGDRFWYENRGFESSFTPAQLHSIRRVSLAQVLCRAVGGGTFQPNIFIPHVFSGNERLPCGIGPLSPIDLSPWLEQDPFTAPSSLTGVIMETTEPDTVFDIISDLNSLTETTQMFKEDKTDALNNLMSPFVNVSTPQEQEMAQSATILQRPLNASKINDKIDFRRKTASTKRPTPKPVKGVNNKLDQTKSGNFNVKSVNGKAGQPATTMKRRIVIHNIPIELRNTVTNDTESIISNKTKTTKPTVTLTNDKKKKKKKNKNSAKMNNKVEARSGNANGKLSNENSFKDETVFDDGNSSKASRENSDPTNLTIELELQTNVENKPFEDFKSHKKTDLLSTTELETIRPNRIQIDLNQTTLKDFEILDEPNIFSTAKNIPAHVKTQIDGGLSTFNNEELTRQTETRTQTESQNVSTTKSDITGLSTGGTHVMTPIKGTNEEKKIEDNQISNKTNTDNELQETLISNRTLLIKQHEHTNDMKQIEQIETVNNLTQKYKSEGNQELEQTNTTMTYETKYNRNSVPTDTINSNNEPTDKPEMTNATKNDRNEKLNDQSESNEELNDKPEIANNTENSTPQDHHQDKTTMKHDNKMESDGNKFTETEAWTNNTKDICDNQTSTDPKDHNSRPTTTVEQFNLNADIEPLTHSLETEHNDLNITLKTKLNFYKQNMTLMTTSTSFPSNDPKDHNSRPTTTVEQFNRDADIDPLTHSLETEHKRVQRKVNYSKMKTELRNVTSPKLLRVNITNQNVKLVTSFKLYSLRNRTVSTTKVPKVTKISRTTENSVELRQYQTRPIYTRPHKVILDGPNSDQYEIEINIRQTNKSPLMKATLSYADSHTTAFKPYGYDRYTNYADYQSTTPAYGFYQPESTIASNFVQAKHTRPPTVIYLDEHDERTTTKQPSLLQNFLSFAASGFGVNRRPTGPSNVQRDKEKPVFSHNSLTGGGLTSTLVSSPHNTAPSSQYAPEPQRQPLTSSSFSQVGSYPVGNGVAHAASGAVSSGNFGAIMGIASANGADSIFSFNIRPRPPAKSASASLSNPAAGSYGLVQPQRPDYAQFSRPTYSNLPIASYPNEQFFAQQTLEVPHSPFSTTGSKKPQPQQSYYSRFAIDSQEKSHNGNDASDPTHHKIEIHDFDYLTKSLQSNVNDNGNNEDNVGSYNESGNLDEEYEYDDIDETNDSVSSKKFNRDGYIRPEFMIETLLKTQDIPMTNVTNANNSNYMQDDNFVLPLLNSSMTGTLDLPTPMALLLEDIIETKTTVNPKDSMPKHLDKDILADDYDDNSSLTQTQAIIVNNTSRKKLVKTQVQNTSLVPITILTKPERPDNWLIYETPVEKPLLPEIPEIKSDTFAASEIPIPFSDLTNVWLTKYIKNKRVKDTANTNMVITTKDSRTKTSDDIRQDKTNDIVQFDNVTTTGHIKTADQMTTTILDDIKTEDFEDLVEGKARRDVK